MPPMVRELNRERLAGLGHTCLCSAVDMANCLHMRSAAACTPTAHSGQVSCSFGELTGGGTQVRCTGTVGGAVESPGDNGLGWPCHIHWGCHGGRVDWRVTAVGGELGLHRENAPPMFLMLRLTFCFAVVDAGPGLSSSLVVSHPRRVGLF